MRGSRANSGSSGNQSGGAFSDAIWSVYGIQ